MLYEMISGKRPFAAESKAGAISAILTGEPTPLTRYTGVPAELERITRKCLQKDKRARFQTASDLLVDLEALKQDTDSRSVANRSAPTRKWINRRWFAYVAIIVLLLGVAGAYYLLRPPSTFKSITSVVVLPFANADPNADYISDGITESLINSLSQLPQLKIMARTTAFRYKGKEVDPQAIGRDLKVDALLTGRVIQQGDSLVVQADLVNTSDGSQIWGEKYNRRLSDLLTVQEEIAQQILERLRLRLTGEQRQQLAKRPTENIGAYQNYLLGRSYAQRRTREDLLMAIRHYQKAIEEDRNYALAYAGLADTYSNLGARGYIAPAEGHRKAQVAARTALLFDQDSAEAHAAMGQAYLLFAPYNLSEGHRELRRAIELSPSLPVAHQMLGNSLLRQGHLDEGLKEIEKARELDPLSSIITRNIALYYLLRRDYPKSLEVLRQADELGPPFGSTFEVGIYVQNNLHREALDRIAKEKLERKSDPILVYSTGMIYARQGKRAEAVQAIRELVKMTDERVNQAHWIAKVYAALNEKELAFGWLERGLSAGAIAAFYKDEPVWDIIRSDPRFRDLLSRIGLPQ